MPKLCTEFNALPRCPELACLSEEFPDHAHLRRLLAIGGRWVSRNGERRALSLAPGASLLLQSRGGVLAELVNWDSHANEIGEASIIRIARACDVIAARGAVLTDACSYAIAPTARQRMRRTQPEIAINNACIALLSSDSAIQELQERIVHLSRAPASDLLARSLLLEREGNLIRQELERFSRGLDQEAVSLCREVRAPSAQLYSYLQHCGSANCRRARHEAIAMFPVLAACIARSDETQATTVRMAIDLGESPVNAIASEYGVSRDVVRLVARRSARELGLEYQTGDRLFREMDSPWERAPFHYFFAPAEMFSALGSLPAKWRPASRIQWRVFQAAAAWAEKTRPRTIGRSVLRNLAKAGWPSTIANGADVVDIDVRLALADLNDFLDAAIDALRVAPDIEAIAPCPAEFFRDEITEFASRTGIRKLISMSRQWHDLYCCAIRAIAKTRGNESGAEAAITLFEEPIQIGVLSIVQLRTESDFLVESAEMGHCVASLFDSALAGAAAYFSVRIETGACVSTFDLSIRRGIGVHRVVLNDHRGPRNCRPVPEVFAAVQEFCRRLSDGDLTETAARYLENMGSTLADQRDNDFVDEADPTERVAHEARRSAARAVLQRLLPKMIRNVMRKCEHNVPPG